LAWTPPTCRWDPNEPPKFTLYLNLVFAWATAVSAANLYYTHPMLDILAGEFRVGEDAIAQVPTVIQAGYAIGLFTLCPLGDVFKRRPLVLRLCLTANILWIILCTTTSLRVFTGVSFVCAFLTVTPQLMFPLVGDLAPPTRRAAALSIVTSGLMLGQLLARLTAGLISATTTFRAVFWLGFALQLSSLTLLYLHMPDYPATNPSGLSYPQNLLSMLRLLTTKPVLAQACTASFFTASTFSLFWTTLTLLLTGPRYAHPNTTVGLFALAILLPVLLSPLFGRKVIDPHVPLFSVLLSQATCLVAILTGTLSGQRTIAGLIVQAALGDFGNQMAQTAWRSAVYAVDPRARNRVNTALMTFVFAGQMTGTAVGSVLYERFGWEGSG
ncbi:major facilitator superfamily domain-containing protein, partial [Elsinoe ampelina]